MRLRIIALVLLALSLMPAQRAFACSLALPSPEHYIDQAEIIAIGTLATVDHDIATLKVEEYLKGTSEKQDLNINNHSFDIDASCQESLGAGGRLPDGVRVLIFLQHDAFGVAEWRPAGIGGFGIFSIDTDQLRPLDSGFGEAVGSLEETKALVAERSGATPPQSADDSNSRQGWSLPMLVLGGLTTITAALALWAMLQIVRRKPLR